MGLGLLCWGQPPQGGAAAGSWERRAPPFCGCPLLGINMGAGLFAASPLASCSMHAPRLSPCPGWGGIRPHRPSPALLPLGEWGGVLRLGCELPLLWPGALG